MSVKVIRADPQVSAPKPESRLLRVAAYCRVSTNSEEQENSYEAQIAHYTSVIEANGKWILAGIFADEGISGTSVRRRDEFNRMIEACEAGKIDLILTKSISRFARNTLDCLNYIRKLKSLGIPVVFEKEAVNTMEASGEVLITILASIAQQESKSISDNVRMGIEFGFQEGKGIFNYSRFLGFRGTGERGVLVIEPEEAKLIRRIYREYLEGYSPYLIAARRVAEGARTAGGGRIWYNSTVNSILGNEKYCGDLLMQKYYTEDFLTHRLVKNRGQRPQYYVEDNHDPIVPKEIFDRVQEERKRRGALKTEAKKLRFGSLVALNGRLICGKCGQTLKCYTSSQGAEADWRCRARAAKKKDSARMPAGSRCDCRIVMEADAKAAILRAFNALPKQKRELDDALARLRTNLVNLSEKGETVALERAELQNREMQLRMLSELAEQLESGQPPELPPETDSACREAEDFFRRTRTPLPEGVLGVGGGMVRFDDAAVVLFLDRVTVEDEGFRVVLKGGVEVRTGAGVEEAVKMPEITAFGPICDCNFPREGL